MKKLLLIAGAALLGLSLGYGGVYLLMPKINPDTLARIQAADSVAAAAATPGALVDSSSGAGHTGVQQASPEEPPDAMALRDSLDRVNFSLEEAGRAIAALEAARDQLTAKIDSVVRTQVSADEIARTVAKLEDEELRSLLRDLPDPVISTLYAVSSLKTRARLLKAMPPDRAADLLQTILAPAHTPVRQ